MVLKSCAPFTKCNLEINDEHVDIAENLDITMPMYNLIEYSDNYQHSSATFIYRNELDKACFQHDSANANHKDLINRTEADKVLKDKAYNIASNPEYDSYQRSLVSMIYKLFDEKSTAGPTAMPSCLERMGSGLEKLKNTTVDGRA